MASSTPRQAERGILLNPKQHGALILKISRAIRNFDDVRTLSIKLFDGHYIDGNSIFEKKREVQQNISIEGLAIYVINEWIARCPEAAFGGRLLQVLRDACPRAAIEHQHALVPKEKQNRKVVSDKTVTRSPSGDDTSFALPPKRTIKEFQEQTDCSAVSSVLHSVTREEIQTSRSQAIRRPHLITLEGTEAPNRWEAIARSLRDMERGNDAYPFDNGIDIKNMKDQYDDIRDKMSGIIRIWTAMSSKHNVGVLFDVLCELGYRQAAITTFGDLRLR